MFRAIMEGAHADINTVWFGYLGSMWALGSVTGNPKTSYFLSCLDANTMI
jgi:hypothetical protein